MSMKFNWDQQEDSDELACAVFPEIDEFQIRQFRISKNMSQAQFAKAYDIPLPTLKRWEADKNTPRISVGFKKAFTEWSKHFYGSKTTA